MGKIQYTHKNFELASVSQVEVTFNWVGNADYNFKQLIVLNKKIFYMNWKAQIKTK